MKIQIFETCKSAVPIFRDALIYKMKALYISHNVVVRVACLAFCNHSIIYTHARLALIHLVLVISCLSTIDVARRLVVVCLCKTVDVAG